MYVPAGKNFEFEKKGNVGIVTFKGDLQSLHIDDLNMILMRAIHGNDRAVLIMNDVTYIHASCLKLLKKAYSTSLRLRKPLIITGVPTQYKKDLFYNESVLKIHESLKSGQPDVWRRVLTLSR